MGHENKRGTVWKGETVRTGMEKGEDTVGWTKSKCII
jgi:hypothetical protein